MQVAQLKYTKQRLFLDCSVLSHGQLCSWTADNNERQNNEPLTPKELFYPIIELLLKINFNAGQ